jgi:NAD(P)H-hydrate epimerase
MKKYSSLDDLKILEEYPVIMDALLGSGLSGGLKDPYKTIIEHVNGVKALKIAVDIPTGLDADKGYADTAFQADYTICLGGLKKGLFFGKGKLYSGIVIKGDIGLDKSYFQSLTADAFTLDGRDILSMLPQRKPDAHKYSAGKTLVIAGSNEYPGAAILASKAAFIAGSGSVILCAPETIKEIVFSSLPEVVFEAYNKEHLAAKHLDELKKRIEWADSIAIGPGLGRQPETIEAVVEILKLSGNKKVIIDADALFAISSVGYKNVDLKNKILTPHLGEFSKLIDIPAAEIDKDITAYGTGFAKETGCILVLKGAPTIVFAPDGKSYINSTGNAGMAKFGMGDSLTGIIASYAAHMQDGLNASLCGVYLHSLSADMLVKEYDINSISASLLIDNFSQAVRDIVSKSN